MVKQGLRDGTSPVKRDYFNLKGPSMNEGWRMVNARLCETARPSYFFASPRHFDFLDCETETSKCLTPSYKQRDCETHITAQKTRLRDP